MPRKVTDRTEQPKADEASKGRTPIVFLPAPDPLPTFYVNNVQIRATLFEAMLDLGVIEEVSEERANVRPQARLMLSLPLAKRLADVLGQLVRDYENGHGPIPTGGD